MKTYYHGTTKTGLNRILKKLPKSVSPWRASDKTKMYFVSSDAYYPYEAIEKAFQQAKLQSCFNEDIDLYVLECIIPDELVSQDTSVDDSPDIQIDCSDLDLVEIQLTHHIQINKYCKPEYIMGMWENGNCNYDAIPSDLRTYIEKVRFNHKDDRPRFMLDRELVDFTKWETSKYIKGEVCEM